MWNFDYTAHRFLTGPAKDKSELWRLVAGLFMCVSITVFLYAFFLTIVFGASDMFGITVEDSGRTASGLVILLTGFGASTVAVFLVVLTLHRRPFRTVFGPLLLVVPQFVRVSVAMVLLLLAVLVLPPWGYGDPLVQNMALGKWLAILPLTLLAILIQTSAEEILFRGYMQQQLAARFNSPLVWMVVPAALFGLMHYDPAAAGEHAFTVVIWAFVFGLVTADLTARSGSLGPAIALHFINNVSALLFVSIPGQLDGAALYVLPFGMEDAEQMRAWLPVDFALICVSWLVARLAIRA
jgi:membrane protease YdiL (CAAX protease family)